MNVAARVEALVIAGHGRQCMVRLPDGRDALAVTRGKRSDVSVGDRVTVGEPAPGQAVIEAVLPRRNEMMRSDEWRAKRLAANLDRIGIVIAPSPPFSEDLLVRVLIAAEAAGIEAALIANKADLPEREAIEPRLRAYEAIGYPVFRVAAKRDPDATRATLAPWLADRTTLLLGQSGMGKSTLVNALIPEARAATREISQALDSGKHTTTHAELYHLDTNSHLVDSPGLQEFGLGHLDRQEIELAFREFRDYLGQCRFRDCRHDREPDCALIAALDTGKIDKTRFATYHRIVGTQRPT